MLIRYRGTGIPTPYKSTTHAKRGRFVPIVLMVLKSASFRYQAQ